MATSASAGRSASWALLASAVSALLLPAGAAAQEPVKGSEPSDRFSLAPIITPRTKGVALSFAF